MTYYPVWGFGNPSQPIVACIFDYSFAVDFILHPELYGFEKQSLYLGGPIDRPIRSPHHDG